MPKSYKICHCSFFDKSKFELDKLKLKTTQEVLFDSDSDPMPVTQIFRSQLGSVYADFEAYRIEHEYRVKALGRYQNIHFESYLRKGEIMAYHSTDKELLLLSGRRDGVIDFTKYTAETPDLDITTIDIDMARLLEKLTSVNLVWFRFPKGMIRASALMGEHIEKTEEFIAAKEAGEISTLSFYLEDTNNTKHPIMVTHDGAVVLQAVYQDVSKELELVLEVKQTLLDDLYVQVPILKKKKTP